MGELLREIKENWPGILAFGAFVLWLLALPMEGELLKGLGLSRNLHSTFLTLHLAGALSVALFLYRFPEALKFSAPAAALLTALLPFGRGAEGALMGALGFSSGILSAYAASSLGRFKKPAAVAAAGLIGGNLLLIPLTAAVKAFPGLTPLATVAVGLGLTGALLLPVPEARGGEKELRRGAPLIFLLYLLLGNSYLYLHFKSPLGLDNAVYGAAVGLALWLRGKREELLLPATVLLLGVSVIAVSLEGGLASLALIQSSAGLADLFTLNLLFKSGSSLRGAGVVIGATVGGIFAGLPFRELFGGWGSTAPLIGNFAISALFALSYLSIRKNSGLEERLKRLGLSRESFSKREWQVLEGVYGGKSLKEIAEEIGVSESSVKTYLGRVYRKVGVGGKRELLSKLKG